RFDGVFGGAVKRLDPQVLFDPLEEQLDPGSGPGQVLPAQAIQMANGQCGQPEMVGQGHQLLAGLGFPKSNPTQSLGIVLPSVMPDQTDGLIAAQTGGLVDDHAAAASKPHVGLGSGNEKRPSLVQACQTSEVDKAAI